MKILENPLPAFQASKWLSCQALLDEEEMQGLFSLLGDISIFITGCVVQEEEASIDRKTFLDTYETYLQELKSGDLHLDKFRNIFSSVLTSDEDHLYAINLNDGRELIRVMKPVIQLQHHSIGFSEEEKKFRPMVLGTDCIPWGLQFSYPQLMQDPYSQKVSTTKKEVNTPLFQSLQKWMRNHTVPTPFIVDGEQINVPMRLGKNCLSWINNYPLLREKNIIVRT